MKNVNILVVIDQDAAARYYENNRSKNPNDDPERTSPPTPGTIAFSDTKKLRDYVSLITTKGAIHTNQGSYDLEVKAHPGDKVHWFESPIYPNKDLQYACIINGLNVMTGPWSDYVISQEGNLYTRPSYSESVRINDRKGIVRPFTYIEQSINCQLKNNVAPPAAGVRLNYDLVISLYKQIEGKYVRVLDFKYDPAIVIYPS